MKLECHLRAAASAAILSLGTAFAAGEGWTSDFEAAKKQAATEKKSLLIDFTGSDWCGWCIKLDKEVFAHDAFKTGVKDKLVLVELDFPRDKSKLSDEVQAQNKELQKKYGVRGFPTILVTDEEGRPFARTGYKPGGPEAYVTHLEELLAVRVKRDAAFADADKAEGVLKAKALIAAIESMNLEDQVVTSFYGEKIEAIKAADPKDETGYVKGMETQQKFGAFQEQINQLASKKDFDAIMKVIDEKIVSGEFEGETQQQVYIFKALTYMQLKNLEDSLKTLDEAKAIAPESEISTQIDMLKKRIEASSVPKP